jgi:hypothetical protein
MKTLNTFILLLSALIILCCGNDDPVSPIPSDSFSLIYAIAVNGNDVYVGGTFGSFRGIGANNIAKWNGVDWSALGSGTGGAQQDAVVTAIAVNGNDVFVGGAFTDAGGITVNHIAKWNGSEWSSLGSGITGMNLFTFLSSIAVNGSELYAGGIFTNAGGVNAKGIARWNGSVWSSF